MSKSTLVELEDRSGVKYKVHPIGDRTYPNYETWKDRDFSELLALIENMEIRSDDVIMTSYPKCGNHWTYEILNLIHQQTTDVPNMFFGDYLDMRTPEQFEELRQEPSPRLMVSSLIPGQADKKGAKMVILVRNVKDVAVSFYHFINILTTLLPYKGTWEDYLEIKLFGRGFVYGTWFDFIKDCDEYIKKYPEAPTYVLVYEELKQNTVEEIKKLCAFMGKPDHLAEAIAEKVSFKNMKKVEDTGEGKFAEEKKATCEPGTSGMMRKGIVGDWKNKFTVAQSERVDKLYDELLADSPIGQRLKKYII